ncbi:MAG: beta-lactamase family protein, partial [Oscillospiraceae bacterium]|nr:beta-lactamase family protein [Oscillospiraceae bacterium]
MKFNFENYEEHGTGYVIKIVYPEGKDLKTETIINGYSEIIPTKKEMKEKCIFDIASLTKFYTAIVMHKAIDKGLVKLDDTITNIDNRFRNLSDVTIGDLLAHKLEIWTDGYLGNAKSKEEFFNMLFNSRVKTLDRTYIDSHYIILSTILEKIYDKSFEKIIEDEILKVLDLKNTAFNPTDKEVVVSNNYQIVNGAYVDDIYPGIVHDNKARVA